MNELNYETLLKRYNFVCNKNKELEKQLDNFCEELIKRVEKEFMMETI